jgi:mannose-1-phosphate guanylyltransferase
MDAVGTPGERGTLRHEWAGVRRVSVDYGIMEHAEKVAVIPVDFGWTDVGNWAALLDVLPGDQAGNVVSGQMVAIDSSGCLVRSEARLVAMIGLKDMVIVDTPDVLLVCPKDRTQDVRELVNRLASDAREEYL